MAAQDVLLLALENAINRVIGLDRYAAAGLANLHGRVVGFEIIGPGWLFFLVPDAGGRVQILARIDGEPDCLMRGTPIDLARSALTEHSEDALFAGRVEVRGDTDLAHRFSEILGNLDIDWEEQLARLTGDIAAHDTGTAARAAGRWADRTRRIATQDLREYLQEEQRLLPSRYEVEAWSDDVDRLRDDVERTAARMARLEAQLAGKDGARVSGTDE